MVCCYTAWGLGSTWVLIGPVRSQQPPPPQPSLLSANPLLPEGLSLHILPADYHHCQSWLLHSSCCPHSGSGANLTRLHGGRKLSHTRPEDAELLPGFSLLPSAETSIKLLLLTTKKRAALLTLHAYIRQAFPSGAFKQYPELQMIRTRSQSSLLGSSSSAEDRQRRFPCRPTCVAPCRCFLWAKSGQSAAFIVQKVTLNSHLRCETQPLSC